MTAPTVVGTATGTNAAATSTPSWSHTINASANAVVACIGGWGAGFVPTLNSVTLNGSNMTDCGAGVIIRPTGQQIAAIYYMHDADANWPGAGTFTIQANWASGLSQFRANAFDLQDVDTSTFIRATGSATSASTSTPNASCTSDANDIQICCISYYNSTPNFSSPETVIRTENTSGADSTAGQQAGASGSLQFDATMNAAVAMAMLVVSIRGTAGGGGGAFLPYFPRIPNTLLRM